MNQVAKHILQGIFFTKQILIYQYFATFFKSRTKGRYFEELKV